MSWIEATDSKCDASASQSAIEMVIEGRPRDLGGFSVQRVLPAPRRRAIGPFVFFDHMGPASFQPGDGIDVRPHPHINLATVTYLFEGEIMHRDSGGSAQAIQPGAINWMTAGRGIVHSERTAPGERARPSSLHGIQAWIGLPKAHEETEPAFHHHPAVSLPVIRSEKAELRLLLGEGWGQRSPVALFSPTIYAEARLEAGARLSFEAKWAERAIYVAQGLVGCESGRAGPGTMWVLERDRPVQITAEESSRIMLLGGDPLDGERHIFWNFVSSSKDRIERAKRDWKEQRFPRVPGDDADFIPLPE